MAKVTKNDLEKLIEGILNEFAPKKFTDKYPDTYGGKKAFRGLPTAADVKDKLKLKDIPVHKDLENMYNTFKKGDEKIDDLSPADIEKAYNTKSANPTAKNFKGAEYILGQTQDSELKKGIEDRKLKSPHYQALAARRAATLYTYDIKGEAPDAKGNPHEIIKNTDAMKQKVRYHAGEVKEYDVSKDRSYKWLNDLVTDKWGGISLMYNIIGVNNDLGKELDKAYKQTSLYKDRFKFRPQQDSPATTISDLPIDTGGSGEAKYRQELIDVFGEISRISQVGGQFEGDNFWLNTLQRMSQFSAFIKSGGTENTDQFSKLKATEYLSMTMGLDYCYRFAKEIEGGGGAYQFEAFLGLLAGGYVGGKDTGIAGGPTEVDFVAQLNGKVILGSAKYYASDAASQSAQSFEIKTPVAYAYAMKYDAGGATTSEAEDITDIKLHIFAINRVFSKGEGTDMSESGTKAYAVKVSDKPEDWAKQVNVGESVFEFTNLVTGNRIGHFKCPSTGQIALKPGVVNETIVGTLQLPMITAETLAKSHEEASGKLKTGVDTAFKAFRSLFEQMIQAKKKATQYSTKGDFDTGKQAFKAIKKTQSDFVSLSAAIAGKKEEKIDDKTDLDESKKITASFLKKIIEESFKK